jgi:hypothetical protein
MDVVTEVSVDILRSRVEALENTVLRLESLMRTIESDMFRNRLNTAEALESLKKSQTGPRKYLGI